MPLPPTHLTKLKELLSSHDHEYVKNGVSLLEAVLDNEDDLRTILRAVRNRPLSNAPQLDELLGIFRRHAEPHRSIVSIWVLCLMAQFNQGIVNDSVLITLSNSELEKIPPALGTLIKLEQLNLQGNKLTRLPDSLSALTKLIKVNLSNNRFTTLPTLLQNYTNLEDLNVRHNPLEYVPHGLRALNVDETQWHNLKDKVDWSALAYLNLSKNNLRDWYPSMVYSTVLTELNLAKNKFTTIPSDTECWYNLRVLRLEKNTLTTLPNTLDNLESLEEFHLQENKLESLPTSICNLSNLKVLNLLGNRLTTLPATLINLSQLMQLKHILEP